MSDRAAIAAQLVDIRNDERHKDFIKVLLHVPVEQGAELTKRFPWASYTHPIPVALAALDLSQPPKEAQQTQITSPNPEQPASDSPPARARKELTMAQRCGIACNDPQFQQYLRQKFSMCIDTEDEAADFMRTYCSVNSRSEIIPDTKAAYKWEKIYGDYLFWRDADKYVESA